MSEFEQQPDDFWRKAFEEAAETPPPRVWDAIERRLDESDGSRVLPLWGTGLGASRPVWWGAGLAAAVTLLLIGWWALHTQTPRDSGTPVAQTPLSQRSTTQPDVSTAPADRPDVSTPDVSTAPAEVRGSRPRFPGPLDVATASADRPAGSLAQTPTAASSQTSRSAGVERASNGDLPKLARNANRSTSPRRAQVSAGVVQNSAESLAEVAVRLPSVAMPSAEPSGTPASALVAGQPVAPTVEANPSATRSAGSVAFTPVPQTTVADPVVSSTPAVAGQLAAQPATQRESALSPLANDAPQAEPAGQPKRQARAVWASVSMMPGAFNPAVAVRTGATPTIASASVLNYAGGSAPTINSRANFSVAYQASAGVQLNERWSVESGVGYLAGRSTVNSPTQVSFFTNRSDDQVGFITADPVPASTRVVSNLYVDVLRSQVSNTLSADQAVKGNNLFNNSYSATRTYSDQTQQALTNNYQYVQVPVQLGYQLRPRKRLGLALLGGLLTNIFVRNTVADEVVITGKDGVYRPLSWAASLGARLRYRPSRRWSASLAGLYQPSLGLGTRPESVVQSQPRSVGMSFGVDYHFNSLP